MCSFFKASGTGGGNSIQIQRHHKMLFPLLRKSDFTTYPPSFIGLFQDGFFHQLLRGRRHLQLEKLWLL
jgi:hypothetical protein